jgi:DNA adenine methylase
LVRNSKNIGARNRPARNSAPGQNVTTSPIGTPGEVGSANGRDQEPSSAASIRPAVRVPVEQIVGEHGGPLSASDDGSCSLDMGNYPGAKGLAGVWQWIIGRMPTHAGYIEAFVGSGVVLRNKPPALSTIVIDRDVRVLHWWERLVWPGVRIVLGDGVTWLEDSADMLNEDTLVYCDPPYLPSTRTKQNLYRFEMTQDQHVALLAAINTLACPCMISGYPSQLYDQALKTWHVESREVITRGGTLRTEVLWCNFPRPSASALSMQYGSLGGNFRERERISRKIKRWVARLEQMPAKERQALLLALLDTNSRSYIAAGSEGGRAALRDHLSTSFDLPLFKSQEP